MTYNLTKWGAPHKKLAYDYWKQNSKLDVLPTDIISWTEYARPYVENKKREFLTCSFWVPIYNDPHDYQMILGGRQIYKSTACTDFLAFTATTNPGSQICYVTHDRVNLAGFSKQKLRISTFLITRFSQNSCVILGI